MKPTAPLQGSRNRIHLIGALIVLLIASTIVPGAQAIQEPPAEAGGQAPRTPPLNAARGSAAVLTSTEEDYRIGPSDILEVQIEDMPELSGPKRVTAAGTFLMAYVGRVVAANKTPEEVAEYIESKLRGDYLKDPKVTVMIREYNSRAFFIQGAVRSPGVYQIEGKPSLLELLTLASGLAQNHGSAAYIIRKIKEPIAPGDAGTATVDTHTATVDTTTQPAGATEEDEPPQYELLKVNINGLMRGRFDLNVYLQPGDIVNVPATDVFFVAGEVNKPGSFPLKDGTTLRQAISVAQGTTFKAALGEGVIFRENTEGKRDEIRVDIADIMKGRKDDVVIEANDIIVVPNSRFKSFGGTLLRAFGVNAVSRGIPY